MDFPKQLWTIGHSTNTQDEFVEILKRNQIELLVDIRHFPGSRKWPWFKKENMEVWLPENGIKYVHIVTLGGHRHHVKDSKYKAWTSEGFRDYAEYMDTDDFHQGSEELKALATDYRSCIMCAEVLWWRCHRRLVSDYFKVGGTKVWDIIGKDVQEHPYTEPVGIFEEKLDYTGLHPVNPPKRKK